MHEYEREGQRGRESQTDSILSAKLDAGLDLTIPRSRDDLSRNQKSDA